MKNFTFYAALDEGEAARSTYCVRKIALECEEMATFRLIEFMLLATLKTGHANRKNNGTDTSG